MEVGSLLIADTDPAVLHTLPQFLSSRLHHINIHVANSPEEVQRKLSQVRYSASVAAPNILEKTDLRLHNVRNRSVLMPVIVTATKTNAEAAREALLHRDAFDVITKPFQPTEALSSIRIAFWQARFLQLLTLRQRGWEQLKRHIEAYPKEIQARAVMENAVEYLEATLIAVRQNMTLVEPSSDQLFFDVAVSIQEGTKERALDRLTRLIAA